MVALEGFGRGGICLYRKNRKFRTSFELCIYNPLESFDDYSASLD